MKNEESKPVKRWWMSWYVGDEDHRPLTYPPNPAILGWWCTGRTETDSAVICGLVQAEDETAAKIAVECDWPGISWRFINEMPPDHVVTSDRFPLSDWMKGRMK